MHLLTTANCMWNFPLCYFLCQLCYRSRINQQQKAAEDCVRITSVHSPNRENFDRKPSGSWMSTGIYQKLVQTNHDLLSSHFRCISSLRRINLSWNTHTTSAFPQNKFVQMHFFLIFRYIDWDSILCSFYMFYYIMTL